MSFLKNLLRKADTKQNTAQKKPSTRAIGVLGENAVVRYLRKKRYRILARNFTVRGGEIDIIAQKGAYIIFVEVKTRDKNRDTEAYGTPAMAVDDEKIRHIRFAAARYLQAHPNAKKPRCDLAEVYLTLPQSGRAKPQAEILYHEEAF